MKKNYLMAMAFVSMVVGGTSCTKEVLETPDSAVVKGQTGKIVFRLDTGQSSSFTRAVAPLSETETKISNLSVHLFKADGTTLTGYKRDYVGTDISDGKLNVTIPASLMGEENVKAYLVANVSVEKTIDTETKLQEVISTIPAGTLPGGVIPMASPAVNLNLTTLVAEASVAMKRAMSVILVKVGEDARFTSGDFSYRLKGVHTDQGYLFKEEVAADGSTSDLSPVPGTDGLLGYIYQSPTFTIEVTPKSGTVLASSGTRVVQVEANSAMKRNKKYVLTLLPKAPEENGSQGFTVQFEEWDSTGFNVDWDGRINIKTNLDATKFKVEGKNITLLPLGTIGSSGSSNYGVTPENWFIRSTGVELVSDINVGNLVNEAGEGLRAGDNKLYTTDWDQNSPNLEDVTKEISITTAKNGIKAISKFSVTLEGQYITWYKGWSTRVGSVSGFRSDNKGRALNLVDLYRSQGDSDGVFGRKTYPTSIFNIASGWKIDGIRAKSPLNSSSLDKQLLLNPSDGRGMTGAIITLVLSPDKNAVTFTCGSTSRGYADFIVTISKDGVTKERFLRITNRW